MSVLSRDVAELQARIVELEAAQRLHEGDTLSLSNELDEWRDRANDAERNFQIAAEDMRRKDSTIEALETIRDELLREFCAYVEYSYCGAYVDTGKFQIMHEAALAAIARANGAA